MRNILSAAGLMVLVLASSSFADVKGLTLAEAISLALDQNLQIKTSDKEIEASEARLSRTKSYFLPKIGLESRYQYFNSPYELQKGGTANFFVEWNIYNGFRDWYDRSGKASELEQFKISKQKQILATRVEVEAIFYKLLGIVESVKSFEEAVTRNNLQIDSARKRRSAGLATDADILEFDLYRSELQVELTRLESELVQAQSELRALLGQTNQDIQFLPQGKLTHYHVDDSLEALKLRLPHENQALIAAKYSVERAEANKQVAFGGYLPQVDLKATQGSRGLTETAVSPETMIMGTAKWEFFSGFDTINARKEAAALAGKSEASMKQTELATVSQLETAYAKLKGIQDRVDIESENKIKAYKFFDVVAAEYKRGVKNSTDMRSASALLLQVVIRDIQYRAEFFEQKSLLEKAVGGEIKISKGSLSGHTD